MLSNFQRLIKEFYSPGRRRKHFLFGVFTAAVICGVLVAQRPDGQLHIWFFDVGQGDAIFIQTPENHQILIDGGPTARVLECLSEVMPPFDRSIDLVVLTHPHADHVVGLLEVLKRFQVSAVVANPVVHPTDEYQEWLELLRQQELEVREAYVGDRIRLGEVAFEVLWPSEEFIRDGLAGDNLNNTSIVLHLSYGDFTALLTGDAEADVQARIRLDSPVDVLKFPHQGSKDSLNIEFLEAASPKLIVITVGKNNFGHPSPQVLEAVAERDLWMMRTDQDGTVEVASDGERWGVAR
ncbi:MBL fold metallo-hydrolase [Candidatus Parcubacteria bacterium]|nr:MBL fold metallo-hydrolase [Candidatus Parcubacteria bacterium]